MVAKPTEADSRDQAGAANRLTHASVLRALSLVKEGRVIDLSLPISMDSPRHSVYLTPYFMSLAFTPWVDEKYHREVLGAGNGIGFVQERVDLDLHTGTHIDALGHTTVAGKGYNGFTAEEMCGANGLARLGIEHLPPMICRGILADVPGCLGRDLDGGEAISEADLRRTLDWQQVTIEEGDFVLVRTNWARFYAKDNARYSESFPGIGLDAGRWLADQGVIGVGSDQLGVEAWPSERAEAPFPVHAELLVNRGVYLLEQAQLDELALERIYEFALLCLAPKWVGATGSPVRLAALI